MAGRSPARFLAPLALVAFAVALFAVVTSSRQPAEQEATPNQASDTRPAAAEEEEAAADEAAEDEGERLGPRFYTVEPGDTPSSIAEERGVPLEQILSLNPNLDAQALGPGTRIRIRQ